MLNDQLEEEEISMFQKEQSFTNQVLVEKDGNKQFYYLPCYIRFKAKSIDDIQIDCLSASLAGVMLVTIYYGDLSPQIVDQFLTVKEVENSHAFSPVVLQLAKGDPIELVIGSGILIKHHYHQKIFDIVIRKTFLCELEGELTLSPFQMLNLYLSLSLQTIHLNPDNNHGKKISIRFNAMDTDIYMKIDSSDDCKFGQYDLAEYYLAAKYTNNSTVPYGERLKRIEEKQKDSQEKQKRNEEMTMAILSNLKASKVVPDHPQSTIELQGNESKLKPKKGKKSVKYFQYVHFRIPLYKYPSNAIATIFIPLWVLGFLNLGIFFQGFDLGGRIAGLATLLLAFIAFLPTIHQQIPPNPSILLVEVLIYLEIVTCFLCFVASFIINLDPTNASFDWRTDGFFIASLIIHVTTIAVILILILIHKAFWEPKYNTIVEGKKKIEFIRETWGNYQCDKAFSKFKHIVPFEGASGSKMIKE